MVFDHGVAAAQEIAEATAPVPAGGLMTLDLTAAHRFIEEHGRAGGTATAIDDVTLRQLVRARIRSEAACDRATSTPGVLDPEDEVYQRQRLKAFGASRP
ncbi:hypothetical protein [Kibdelosporangium phytohabitans]|uniref:Uncharacterized protein n=1 Tax=Kibdelosporangium phytohabitans TaxID=860235 RepID=A0A0N7F4M2_9PSEU|nr:hypothetical protein [Kibdelosporangium phytohabitans]ALG11823.1 hypothetical protein AOZ06_37525 [Kibdelosporangium phytohabitans]MBE1463237.1 hypothetical protein [Kibdelosporangium phytohabitans]